MALQRAQSQKPEEQFRERRKDERSPASGTATLRINGGERIIAAEMVDVSPSGFRIRYHGQPLSPGSQVDITYAWGTVRARIVWNRELGGWCDSGFCITK